MRRGMSRMRIDRTRGADSAASDKGGNQGIGNVLAVPIFSVALTEKSMYELKA